MVNVTPIAVPVRGGAAVCVILAVHWVPAVHHGGGLLGLGGGQLFEGEAEDALCPLLHGPGDDSVGALLCLQGFEGVGVDGGAEGPFLDEGPVGLGCGGGESGEAGEVGCGGAFVGEEDGGEGVVDCGVV